MSDLHMEFKGNVEFLRQLELKATGDVLVMAGDIFYLDNAGIAKDDFWKWASDNYEQVMVIPGNHEFYGGYDITRNGFSWEYKLAGNVGVYQNKVLTLGDTDFILTTLWSYIPAVRQSTVGYFLNDFHRIKYGGREYTPDDYNAEHERSLNFVKSAIAGSKASHRVVVTHHVPTLKCSPRKFKLIRNGVLECAFVVDLTDYIRQAPIDCWIYGHSHASIDAEIGGTRVLSNQLGYVARGEHIYGNFDFRKNVTI